MPTSGALKAMLKSDDGKNQKDWKMEEESLGNHYYYWHRMHETIHIKDDDITGSISSSNAPNNARPKSFQNFIIRQRNGQVLLIKCWSKECFNFTGFCRQNRVCRSSEDKYAWWLRPLN